MHFQKKNNILILIEGVKDNAKKHENLQQCIPMNKLQTLVFGKWEILILWYIATDKVRRFGELQKQLDHITTSSLTKQLRELEADGFISRQVYPVIPPKTEYTLTALGKSFIPVLEHMYEWSITHLSS